MPFRPDTFALTLVLALLTGLGPVTVDISIPSLPAIADAFATTGPAAQGTITGYIIGFAIAQIFHGPISDRVGRRPVILASLVAFVLASIACAFATSVAMLIAFRVVQAVAAAGPIILARAVVRDLYSGVRAARELSIMASIMGIAPILAPVLGGFLQARFGWSASFLATALLGVAGILMVWFGLPETLQRRASDPLSVGAIVKGFATIWRNRAYRAYAAVLACGYAGLLTYIAGSSFVIEVHYGLAPIAFSFAFASGALAYILGTVIGRALAPRLGLDATIGVGTACLAAGGLLVAAGVGLGPDSVFAFIAPIMVFTTGIGIVLPQTLAAALTPFPDRAGAASSLLGFIQMGAAAVAMTIATVILGEGIATVPTVLSIVGIGALATFLATRRVRAAQS